MDKLRLEYSNIGMVWIGTRLWLRPSPRPLSLCTTLLSNQATWVPSGHCFQEQLDKWSYLLGSLGSSLPSCGFQVLFFWSSTSWRGMESSEFSQKLTNVSSKPLLDPTGSPTLAASEMPCPAHGEYFDELNKNSDNPNKLKLCGPWGKGKKFRKIGQLIIYSFAWS